MKKKPIRDEDLIRARRCMQEAAQDARRIAYHTRTPLILFEDGRVIKKWMSKDDLK